MNSSVCGQIYTQASTAFLEKLLYISPRAVTSYKKCFIFDTSVENSKATGEVIGRSECCVLEHILDRMVPFNCDSKKNFKAARNPPFFGYQKN